MSRSVRDLRDLICVSRLTYRESDDEEYLSEGEVTVDFNGLSLTSSDSDTPRTTPVKTVTHASSPDSGILTAGSLPESNGKPSSASKPGSKKKRRRKLLSVSTKHDLPTANPLPPVSTKLNKIHQSSDHANKKVNFDQMMCFMDASIVAGWLTSANESVEQLAKFCNSEDNFIQFAHFWLSEFPDIQKQEILELEFNILIEEICVAFAVGRESRQIVHRDIQELISALFREYPSKLVSSKGPHLFLDYLDIMSSARKDQYRKLLADVRCSTRNKQYAQWLLAIRSFALVNVWTAVTNFYQNLHQNKTLLKSIPVPLSVSNLGINQQRFYQAIRCGYVDVIHYFIVSDHVDPLYIDNHNRTYIFSAVMNNKPKVVQYLIQRVKPVIDINVPSDTGNTALHAAANSGHYKIVVELLSSSSVDVNCQNPQCDGATPLHLAVMHGHAKVVELLLQAKADVRCKMGDLSAVDIAQDFGHDEILALLQETL